MNGWQVLAQVGGALYVLAALLTVIRIIHDTRNPVKSLAYVMLTVFVPFVGMAVYYSFGLNYRKRRLYRRKRIEDSELFGRLQKFIAQHTEDEMAARPEPFGGNENLARMLVRGCCSPILKATEVKLLVNGEQKFPELIAAMEAATDHIHIEYYIYADDDIGNTLKEIMIHKASQGVQVRFIYDDFGSHGVNKRIVGELRAAGVEAYPYYQIRLYALANRMNFRNHRKVAVIDGRVGFVGGINVDDRYINNGRNVLYWRDTHLLIRGNAVASLQYVFMSDWNSCAPDRSELGVEPRYFPLKPASPNAIPVQIAESGPNSINGNIMLSVLGIIMNSRERLYITTPYFIPNETIVDALKYSAMSGVDVRLLVPGQSDSRFVNAASESYYGELLAVGVRIWRYRKGFVHAKSIVSDRGLAVVGSANMDIRSFELMFEVNALVFSADLNRSLCDAFMNDLMDSAEITPEEWEKRPAFDQFTGRLARLGSPML